MEQYIPKSALVAEIERRIERCAKQREDMLNVQCHTLADDASARMGELRCFQDFIDTLEVKEVDLDEEIKSYFKGFGKFPSVGIDDCIDIAKHFFELGVNVSNPLTWRDMAEIDKIASLLENEWLNSTPWDGIRDWGFYQEVLKRFKAQKREKI